MLTSKTANPYLLAVICSFFTIWGVPNSSLGQTEDAVEPESPSDPSSKPETSEKVTVDLSNAVEEEDAVSSEKADTPDTSPAAENLNPDQEDQIPTDEAEAPKEIAQPAEAVAVEPKETWFIIVNGKRHGPYTRKKLISGIARGRVKPYASVDKGDLNQAMLAREAFPLEFEKKEKEAKAKKTTPVNIEDLSSSYSKRRTPSAGYATPPFTISLTGGLKIMSHSIDSGDYHSDFKKEFKDEYAVASFAVGFTPRWYLRRVSSETFGVGFGVGYTYFDNIHTATPELNFISTLGKNSFRYTFAIPIGLDIDTDYLTNLEFDNPDASGDVSYSPSSLDIGFGLDFCYERILAYWFSLGLGLKGTLVTKSISTNTSSRSNQGGYTTSSFSVGEDKQNQWFPALFLYAEISFRAALKSHRGTHREINESMEN